MRSYAQSDRKTAPRQKRESASCRASPIPMPMAAERSRTPDPFLILKGKSRKACSCRCDCFFIIGAILVVSSASLLLLLWMKNRRPSIKSEQMSVASLLNDCWDSKYSNGIRANMFSSELWNYVEGNNSELLILRDGYYLPKKRIKSILCYVFEFLDENENLAGFYLIWLAFATWYLTNVIGKYQASKFISPILAQMKQNNGRMYIDDAKTLVSSSSMLGRIIWPFVAGIMEDQFNVQRVQIEESKPFWALPICASNYMR